MSKKRAPAEMSAQQVRGLPWPRALKDRNQTLSAEDSYQVGKLIVESVYHGEYTSSRGRKAWSLRKLQAVLKAASAATLARSVQTYQTASSLGLKPPLRHIDMGHLVRISSLQRQQQRKLIKRVATEGWGVQKLQEEVVKIRGKVGRGRPPSPGFVKALNALSRHDLLANMDRVAELDEASGRALAKRISTVQDDLKRIQQELRRHGF